MRPVHNRRSLAPLTAALCVLAAPALAAELLTPEPPVSPEGFDVLVVGGGTLTASPAEVTALPRPAGAFRVVPKAGAMAVKLEAGGVAKTLKVGPPATSVTLSLPSTAPVKGRDTSTMIDVLVRGADGTPDPESAPPVLRANVGAIEALESVGPGRYRARYVLPTTRYPEVAIIVAFAAWPHPQSTHGALGVLRVPLASAVEVPGHTEAGAEMRLTIAGTTFGPVTAGPDGAFRLPVVVPPGYGRATGTAIDRIGNKRSVPIDLLLPPTDQLACVVTPTRLPPDGRAQARVLCATSDVFGGVARGAGAVALTVKAGALSAPRDLGDGVAEWSYTAPTVRGEGKVVLAARWRPGGVESREELSLELVQGPVAKAALALADDGDVVAHLGGSVAFAVTVTDSLGRPVSGVSLSSPTPGLAAKPSDVTGKVGARWRPAPATALGPTALPLVAWGPVGSEPAAVHAFREANRLFASVTDLAGLPVPRQALRLDGKELVTGDDGAVELAPLADGSHDLQHARWPGLRLRVYVREGGKALFPESAPTGRVTLEAPMVVGPPVPIAVRLVPERAGFSWWLETADGDVVDGREVQLTINGAVTRAKSSGHTRVEVPGGKAGVAIVDVASHVGAAAEVGP